VRDERSELAFERVAAQDERVDRAEVVAQGDLRRGVAQLDPVEPLAVADRPGPRALEADVVAQEELAGALLVAST